MNSADASGSFFERAYQEGETPWDIGRPQQEFVRLAKNGEIHGSVLDVGCGTGENAIYLAELGHETWGIDVSPTAILEAREKAKQRGVDAIFLVFNALDLRNLRRTFDSVVDSGFFHTLSDSERSLFVRGLTATLRPGGTYFMLCFSEHEPGSWGPRRVTQAEIRTTFHRGWRINYIKEARFETRLETPGPHAWLASITREAL